MVVSRVSANLSSWFGQVHLLRGRRWHYLLQGSNLVMQKAKEIVTWVVRFMDAEVLDLISGVSRAIIVGRLQLHTYFLEINPGVLPWLLT